MTFRNIWLKLDEWKLIREEFPDSFELSDRELKEWNLLIKDCKEKWNMPEQPRCFPRCKVYYLVKSSQNPKVVNTLCRENWRSQDMHSIMYDIHDFIGFIITHCDDVSMDTTHDEWEKIRNQMNNVIEDSDKRIWFHDDLTELYQEVIKS